MREANRWKGNFEKLDSDGGESLPDGPGLHDLGGRGRTDFHAFWLAGIRRRGTISGKKTPVTG